LANSVSSFFEFFSSYYGRPRHVHVPFLIIVVFVSRDPSLSRFSHDFGADALLASHFFLSLFETLLFRRPASPFPLITPSGAPKFPISFLFFLDHLGISSSLPSSSFFFFPGQLLLFAYSGTMGLLLPNPYFLLGPFKISPPLGQHACLLSKPFSFSHFAIICPFCGRRWETPLYSPLSCSSDISRRSPVFGIDPLPRSSLYSVGAPSSEVFLMAHLGFLVFFFFFFGFWCFLGGGFLFPFRVFFLFWFPKTPEPLLGVSF